MSNENVERLAKQISIDHQLSFSMNPRFDELWLIPTNRGFLSWLRSMRNYRPVSNPVILVRLPKDDLSGVRPYLRQSETYKFYDLRKHLESIGRLSDYDYLFND